MSEKDLKIKLMELEIKALRSVLSEFEGDKMEYSQMSKANAIADVLLVLP